MSDTPDKTPQQYILAAIHRCILKIGKVKKEAKNPRFDSTYATLEQVLDFVTPHLFEEGLVMSQSPGYNGVDKAVTMVLSFIDVEGNSLNYCTSAVPVGKIYPKGAEPQEANAQTAIAAQTYLARTQIAHVFRLNLTDDDGNESTGWTPRNEPASVPVSRSLKPRNDLQPHEDPRGADEPPAWGPEEDDVPGQFRFKNKVFKLQEMSLTQLGTVSFSGNFPENVRSLCKWELHRRKSVGDASAAKILADNAQ